LANGTILKTNFVFLYIEETASEKKTSMAIHPNYFISPPFVKPRGSAHDGQCERKSK